jgi:hypothetical protein
MGPTAPSAEREVGMKFVFDTKMIALWRLRGHQGNP